MNHFDVLIIGSGISSIISAGILSKKGYSVVVLEQHSKLGGYLHTFFRNGYEFETGAHYVGSLKHNQTFFRILKYLDLYNPECFFQMSKSGFDRFIFPNFEVDFVSDYEKTIGHVVSLFPEEEKAIRKYFSLIEEAAKVFPTYELTPHFDSQLVNKYLSTTLSQVIIEITSNTNLQMVFAAYCGLHGVQPEKVSFGLHALLMDSFFKSAYLFKNGGQFFVDHLVSKLKERGVVFKTNSKVEKLICQKQSINLVQCENGESFTAEWIISGIHPKNTFSLVDGNMLKPAFQKRLAGIEETVGISSFYFVSKDVSSFEMDKNYFYIQATGMNDLLDYGSITSVNSLFLSSPHRSFDLKHSFSAHVFSPIDWFAKKKGELWEKHDDYDEQKEILKNAVVGKLCGYSHNFRQNISFVEMSTPLSNIRYNGSVEGSAYGLLHSLENTGMRALGPRTHFDNLLLTGQNTLFPGILGSAISGLRTAGHIVGIKSILKEL